jgi:hypothetical protein
MSPVAKPVHSLQYFIRRSKTLQIYRNLLRHTRLMDSSSRQWIESEAKNQLLANRDVSDVYECKKLIQSMEAQVADIVVAAKMAK